MNKQMLRGVVFVGLFIVPFVPLFVSGTFFFPFITTKAFVWRIAVEVVFAAWLLLALLEPEVRPKKSVILSAVGLFLLLAGIADLFGVDRAASFWSNFERMDGFVSLLHLGAFFLVTSSVFNEGDWKRWWNTSIFVSGLMVLYCLAQLAGLKTINQGGVRVDGTFGNAIYLAVYLVFHIFMMLFYALRAKKNAGLQWLYGGLIALELVILYYTATRGAILGLMGGVLVFALLNVRNREYPRVRQASIALIVAVAVIVGAFFAARHSTFVKESPVLGRFASISLSELQSQGRYYVWPMAWQGFKEHPILGWGQENFTYVFQEHYRPEMYNLEPWFDRAHNIFLDWLVAGGLLTLLAYLALYGTLLYSLWKSASFTGLERSILTALVAAYFFHNIFVFDNLGSYILFFSVLAYVHGRTGKVWNVKPVSYTTVNYLAVPVGLALVLTLYFVNVKPISANATLIEALGGIQGGNLANAEQAFERAYAKSPYLGRSELSEQIATNAVRILSSDLPTEEKNQYFAFAQNATLAYAASSPTEARPQLIAGSFLSSVNELDESLAYLEKAKKLMPNKQEIYYEEGAAYINAGKYAQALESFREAYALAPGNREAKLIYLIGAIYAKDFALEARLKGELADRDSIFDDRVIAAYYAAGRMADVRFVLNERKRLDPANATTYDKYLEQVK
jgi:O-antigen ligase